MESLLKNKFTKKGTGYGLLGTLAMSLIMLIGMGTGISPMNLLHFGGHPVKP